jgi:hypothetical protein
MTVLLFDVENPGDQSAVRVAADARGRPTADIVRTLTYLFHRYRHSAEDFRLIWRIVAETAEAGDVKDFQGTGDRLRTLFDHRLQALDSLRALHATLSVREDRFRDDLALLKKNAAEVRELRDRIFANWPWPLSGAAWVEKPIPQPPPADDALREHLRREQEEGRLLTKEQFHRDALGPDEG